MNSLGSATGPAVEQGLRVAAQRLPGRCERRTSDPDTFCEHACRTGRLGNVRDFRGVENAAHAADELAAGPATMEKFAASCTSEDTS
jgi:hypothetical protein